MSERNGVNRLTNFSSFLMHLCTCTSVQPNRLYSFSSLLLPVWQRNQVQRGSALKRSRLTPGRACRLEWGCLGSGPGTLSLSGSRWPCSCKWQLQRPSTVQVRAYHLGHVFCWPVAEKKAASGWSFICSVWCVCGRAVCVSRVKSEPDGGMSHWLLLLFIFKIFSEPMCHFLLYISFFVFASSLACLWIRIQA